MNQLIYSYIRMYNNYVWIFKSISFDIICFAKVICNVQFLQFLCYFFYQKYPKTIFLKYNNIYLYLHSSYNKEYVEIIVSSEARTFFHLRLYKRFLPLSPIYVSRYLRVNSVYVHFFFCNHWLYTIANKLLLIVLTIIDEYYNMFLLN